MDVMLSRQTPRFVDDRILDVMESTFMGERMTDRRTKHSSASHAGKLDTQGDCDVTNLSSETFDEMRENRKRVTKDIEFGDASSHLQGITSCLLFQQQTIMTSMHAVKEQDESSVDYMALLSSRPQHEIGASKFRSRPRLTLSAFRRPEEIVRVADPDCSRKLTDAYRLCGGIGHGAMSTVRLAERISDGVKFAVKTVSKHDVLRTRRFGRRRRHMDEWEVLRLLKDNPNVVDLIDVYETDDEVQMVLEYCKGGELFDYIQRKRTKPSAYIPSEAKAAKITEQMLSVLNDLHGRGIVHRDVKPENLLLTCDGGSEVKICDFGIARLLLDECDSESCSSDDEGTSPGRMRAYSRVGSDLYAAPEVCMGDGYGTAVDMYSLGVTIFVFLYGFSPVFDLQEDGEVGVTFPDNQWSQVSEDAKDLIRQMLDVDPEHRITAERALESPWIKRHAGSDHFSGANGDIAVRRRASHLFSLSPTKPRPSVDLELVKARLYKNIESDRKRSKAGIRGTRKKPRMASKAEREPRRPISARDGEALMSMADLYRGVASAAASATSAAKGVVCDERQNVVNVLVDDSNDEISDDDVDSMLALSV
jgi:serine/threonine protein kinase